MLRLIQIVQVFLKLVLDRLLQRPLIFEWHLCATGIASIRIWDFIPLYIELRRKLMHLLLDNIYCSKVILKHGHCQPYITITITRSITGLLKNI